MEMITDKTLQNSAELNTIKICNLDILVSDYLELVREVRRYTLGK